MTFTLADQVKRKMDTEGSHWWEPSAMRFFGTIAHQKVYGGRYFITSEMPPRDYRRYSVREIKREIDGKLGIDTVGEICEYGTAAQARRAIRVLLVAS